MPRLTHLAILHRRTRRSDASTFVLNLTDHPNIQTLRLEDVHLHAPVAPYASLRHLKLTQCGIMPPPAAGSVSALRLCAVHNTLGHFPNLETLSLVHSLSEGALHDPPLRELPKLTKTVRLPRLRHLELIDIPAYIPLLLSHLVFPVSTALVLEPASTARHFSPDETIAVPLFPGINPSPSPSAELTLSLFRVHRGAHTEHVACWETRGAGVRRVCVTLASYGPLHRTLLARFTRELVAALTPAPTASGVTELTLDPFTYLHNHDWELLLPEVPGLRLLSCLAGHSAETLVKVFGERRPLGQGGERDSEFLCPRVTELTLGWHIPYATKDEDWEALQLELQDDATDSNTGPVPSPSDKSVDGTDVDAGSSSSRRRRRWIAAPLAEFSEALRACLVQRAAGHCESIEVLSVFPHWKYGLDG
ncbi:hypothetical protein GSI_10129 [Ganoderma sinense ZZ0214-1]|uniref:Uncharacterized protein n=1 Tax=Ganoderma sinense ZZ0214-1 TaxID=1077348 RepID=A0A2G8RZP3_9APHY|nr:hypothetical protein GSI_10129 [Ganoderma sinense ZZ0214-1]